MNINDSMPALRQAIDHTGPFILAMDTEDAVAIVFLIHQLQLNLPEDALGYPEKVVLDRLKVNMQAILKRHHYLFKALEPLMSSFVHIDGELEYIRIMAATAAKRPELKIKPMWNDYRIALLSYALRECSVWAYEPEKEEPIDPPSLDRILADGMAQLEHGDNDWAHEQLEWFNELQDRAAATHWENTLTRHTNNPA